jgi:hypothetical protein
LPALLFRDLLFTKTPKNGLVLVTNGHELPKDAEALPLLTQQIQ